LTAIAASLLIGWGLFYYWNRMIQRASFEWPGVIRNPAAGVLLLLSWIGLFVYSVVQLFLMTEVGSFVLAGVLVALVAWQRVKHGPIGTARRVVQAYARLKHEHPQWSEEEICAAIARTFLPGSREQFVKEVAEGGSLERVRVAIVGALHGV
jgi:hypothetical protein